MEIKVDKVKSVCLRESFVARRLPPPPLEQRSPLTVSLARIFEPSSREFRVNPIDESSNSKTIFIGVSQVLPVSLWFRAVQPPLTSPTVIYSIVDNDLQFCRLLSTVNQK